MKRYPWLFAVLGILGAERALADTTECRIVVLNTVRDDIGNTWHAGQTLPADVARDGPGGRSFCSTGGSCVPQQVNGTPTVRLENCLVGASLGDGDGDHALVADPGQMGAAAARRFTTRAEVERRLADMGFSLAAAGSFADDDVNRPGSANARLVARALGGSQAAIAAMRAKMP